MTEIYWLSCSKMTVRVDVRDGVIIDAAPVVRKFVGQPLENLTRWMWKLGGFKRELIGGSDAD